MPPAVAVPIALFGASMIANNVQQKAAEKNNLNQQAGAVQNARAAGQRAMNWVGQNPDPVAGMRASPYTLTPQGTPPPGLGTPQAPGPQAPTMAPGGTARDVTMNPTVQALLQRIMAARGGGFPRPAFPGAIQLPV